MHNINLPDINCASLTNKNGDIVATFYSIQQLK